MSNIDSDSVSQYSDDGEYDDGVNVPQLAGTLANIFSGSSNSGAANQTSTVAPGNFTFTAPPATLDVSLNNHDTTGDCWGCVYGFSELHANGKHKQTQDFIAAFCAARSGAASVNQIVTELYKYFMEEIYPRNVKILHDVEMGLVTLPHTELASLKLLWPKQMIFDHLTSHVSDPHIICKLRTASIHMVAEICMTPLNTTSGDISRANVKQALDASKASIEAALVSIKRFKYT